LFHPEAVEGQLVWLTFDGVRAADVYLTGTAALSSTGVSSIIDDNGSSSNGAVVVEQRVPFSLPAGG
jgi:hypothetical protein